MKYAMVVCALVVLGFGSMGCDNPAERRGMPTMDAPDGNFSGEVVERISAGSYTYMRVAAPSRQHWVVTIGRGKPTGTRVDITNMGVREDFRSRRLNRTFDRLVFAIVTQQS